MEKAVGTAMDMLVNSMMSNAMAASHGESSVCSRGPVPMRCHHASMAAPPSNSSDAVCSSGSASSHEAMRLSYHVTKSAMKSMKASHAGVTRLTARRTRPVLRIQRATPRRPRAGSPHSMTSNAQLIKKAGMAKRQRKTYCATRMKK